MMGIADLRKAELAGATLSIRNGTAKVVIIDEGLIPDQFMRIKKEPNKTAIKTAIEGGQGHSRSSAFKQ